MPKKTKKEKIIALYRRKLKLLEPLPQPSAIKITQQELPPIIEKKQTASYFLSDLRKSLILAGVVIALEISLYFVRIIK